MHVWHHSEPYQPEKAFSGDRGNAIPGCSSSLSEGEGEWQLFPWMLSMLLSPLTKTHSFVKIITKKRAGTHYICWSKQPDKHVKAHIIANVTLMLPSACRREDCTLTYFSFFLQENSLGALAHKWLLCKNVHICSLPNPTAHNYKIRLKHYKWLITQKSKKKKSLKWKLLQHESALCFVLS